MSNVGKRILSIVLAFILAINFMTGGVLRPIQVSAVDSNVTAGNIVIAPGSGDHTITGTTNSNTIVVQSNYVGTITLKDVKIAVLGTPMVISQWADVTLVLEGANELTSTGVSGTDNGYAGLHVPNNARVTIKGSGSLTATASSGGTNGSAGIGGDASKLTSCGTILIESGTVTATGGGTFNTGAGIGGASGSAGGNITISGGKVTAIGGGSLATNALSGAAGIGGGGDSGGGGNITISGGTILATGGGQGAGIGGACNGATGNITITGGTITASAGNHPTNPYGAGIGSASKQTGHIFIGGRETNYPVVNATSKSTGLLVPAIGGAESLVILPYAKVNLTSPAGTNQVGNYNKLYFLRNNSIQSSTVTGLPITEAPLTARTQDNTQNIKIYVKALDAHMLKGTGAFIGNTGSTALLSNLYCSTNMIGVAYFSDEKNASENKLVYGESKPNHATTPIQVVLPLADSNPSYELNLSSTSEDLGTLPYGYTRQESLHASHSKSFTVTNNSNEYLRIGIRDKNGRLSLDEIKKILIFSGQLINEPDFAGTSIPAKGSADIKVQPQMHLDAGNYEIELEFYAADVDGVPPVSVALKLVVTKKDDSGTIDPTKRAGNVTAIPDPSADPINPALLATPITLTAKVNNTLYPQNTLDKWYYTTTTNSAAPAYPSAAWTVCNDPPVTTSPQDVEQSLDAVFQDALPDGNYYIHWRLDTKNTFGSNGIITAADGVTETYKLDRTKPTMTVARQGSAIGSISGDFNVVVTVTDANLRDTLGTDFSAANPSHFAVTNATASLVSFNGTNEFAIKITPTGGSDSYGIELQVLADAITDKADNPNTASTKLTVPFDSRKPIANFDNIDGEYFNAPITAPQNFVFTIDSQNLSRVLTNSADTVVDGTNAHTVFTLKKTINSVTTTLDSTDHFSVVFAESTGRFTITPKVGVPFTDGEYTIEIASGGVKNAGGIAIDQASAIFYVYKPEVIKITATPEELEFDAATRTVVFTITGKNLKVNEKVSAIDPRHDLKLGLIKDPTGAIPPDTVIVIPSPIATWGVDSDGNDTCTFTASIPVQSDSTMDVNHIYAVYLSQEGGAYTATGKSATVTLLKEKRFTLSITNSRTENPPALTFGYLSNAITANHVQTITVRNTGNQTLHNFAVNLTTGSAAFDLGTDNLLAGFTLAENATVTFTVTTKHGLNTGEHPVTVKIEADNNKSGAERKSAIENKTLFSQWVLESENDAAIFTNNTSPTNTNVTLHISAANPAAARQYARYQVTTDATLPGATGTWTDFAGGSDQAIVPFGYPDQTYYIHWELKFANFAKKTGTFTFAVDRAPATASVTAENWINAGKINAEPRTVTFVYTDFAKDSSNNPTETNAVGFATPTLTSGDFDLQNCSITGNIVSTIVDNKLTIVAQVKPGDTLDQNDPISIRPKSNVLVDQAGNYATQPVAYTGLFDGVRPIATLTTPKPMVNGVFNVTLEFSKPIIATAAQLANLVTVSNGTLSNMQAGIPAGQKFAFDVTPTAKGDVIVTMPENKVKDSAGNGNTLATLSTAYDNIAPTAALATATGRDKFNGAFDTTVTFSKKVTGLLDSHFNITAVTGTMPGRNLSTVDNITYTLRLTPSGTTGTYTIKLPQNAAIKDLFGNALITDSGEITVYYDSTPLTVVLSKQGNQTASGPFTANLVFNKDVDTVALTPDRFSVANATVTNIQGTGKNYTMTVNPTIPTGEYTILLRMDANKLKDSFGNDNLVSNPLSIRYNNRKPTVGYDIQNNEKFLRVLQNFTITASEELYTMSDNLVGAAEMNSSLVVKKDGTTQPVSTTKAGNVFTIGSSFVPGSYTVSIPGDTLQNEFGNSLDASSRSFEVWDPTVFALSASPSQLPSGGGTVHFLVDGVFLGDFSTLHMENVRLGTSSSISGFAGDYDATGQSAAALPASPTVEDETYEFEVYANGVPTGIRSTVTVAGKGRPDIRSMTAQPSWLPYIGGDTEIILSGVDLGNLPVSLTLSTGETHDIPSTQISGGGTSAVLSLGISGNEQTVNSIVTVEANVNGVPTGIKTNVVIGAFQRPHVFAENPMELEHHINHQGTSDIVISLGMSGETATVAERVDILVQNTQIVSVSRGATSMMRAAAMETATVTAERVGSTTIDIVFYDHDGNPMPEYGETIAVIVSDNYSYADDDDVGSGGRDEVRGDPSATWWIELSEAKELVVAAKKNETTKIPYRRQTSTGIRKDAALHMKGYVFHHDTIDDNRNVRVRVILNQPELVTHDTLLSGYVDGQRVDTLSKQFAEWFPNKVRIISMEEQGSFGLRVKLAAKLDLSGINLKNLYFYSYDSKTRACTRLVDPNYSIDGKGYLHFFTEQAGDLIVSDGPLYGTDTDPLNTVDMHNPSSGGDGMNPDSPAFPLFLSATNAQLSIANTLKGLGGAALILLVVALIWAFVPRKRDEKARGK